MRVLAVIPARGGSKGVKRKNAMTICGKPILSYTVDYLHSSAYTPEIVVTSEDTEILKVADHLHIETEWRHPALQGDDGYCVDAVRDVFLGRERAGERYDLIAMLYASTPVRPEGALDCAIDMMINGIGISSIQTVTEAGAHHPWWSVEIWDGLIRFPNGQPAYSRHDLPARYYLASAFWLFRPEYLRVSRKSSDYYANFGPKIGGFVVDEHQVVDINVPADIERAKWAIRRSAVPEKARAHLLQCFGF